MTRYVYKTKRKRTASKGSKGTKHRKKRGGNKTRKQCTTTSQPEQLCNLQNKSYNQCAIETSSNQNRQQ